MSVIASNLQAVRKRIDNASQITLSGPRSVRLVAISKGASADALLEAFALGQRDFGENYLQEALAKRAVIDAALRQSNSPPPVWHMTGPLQSNKTRAVAEFFDWVQTLDRLTIGQRLSAQRPAHLPALKILIQVNISAEASKSGVAPDALAGLAHAIAALPRLELVGLMAIPAPGDVAAFGRLAQLMRQLRGDGLALTELSMGMSDDYEAAIDAGATMVRIGSAIFGPRPSRAALNVP